MNPTMLDTMLGEHIDGLSLGLDMIRRLGPKACLRADEEFMPLLAGLKDEFAVSEGPDTRHWFKDLEWKQSVSVRGQGPISEWRYLRGSASHVFLTIRANNVIFERMKFSTDDTYANAGIFIYGNNVSIRDCVFDGFAVPITILGAQRAEISNCIIRNHASHGIVVTDATGVAAQYCRIQNNQIEYNRVAGTRAIFFTPLVNFSTIIGNNCEEGEIRYTNSTPNYNIGDLTNNVGLTLTVY